MTKSRAFLLLFLLVGLGVGCSDDKKDEPVTPPAGETASLRVVHASPDAPPVDIWAEGVKEPLARNLKYAEASQYVSVPKGSYNIQVRAAPSTESDAVVYSTGLLALAGGAKITAVAAGSLKSTNEADKFRVLPLTEGFAPTGGKLRVRIVHAGADAPTVGIDVGNDNPSAPEVASLARFADTGKEGVELTAGQALQIGVTAAGARVTSFSSPGIPADTELLVVAVGLLSKHPRQADGFALLGIGSAGVIALIRQDPVVYALHGSPNVGPVDIFAGPLQLADNLAFGALSTPIQVPPSMYALDFFPHLAGIVRPAGDPAATVPTGSLLPGERYLAVATGLLGDTTTPFQLAAFADQFAPGDGSKVTVRAVHASPGTPAVNIGVVTSGAINPVLFSNLSFPNASAAEGVEVAPATYTLGIAAASAPATIAASFTAPLTTPAKLFAVALGQLPANPAPPQALRLGVVNTSVWPWTIASISPIPPINN